MRQANQSFHYASPEGRDVFVPKGRVLPDDHPDVSGREVYFDTLELEEPQQPTPRGRRK